MGYLSPQSVDDLVFNMSKFNSLESTLSGSKFMLLSLSDDDLGVLNLLFFDDGLLFSLFGSSNNSLVFLQSRLGFLFGISNPALEIESLFKNKLTSGDNRRSLSTSTVSSLAFY